LDAGEAVETSCFFLSFTVTDGAVVDAGFAATVGGGVVAFLGASSGVLVDGVDGFEVELEEVLLLLLMFSIFWEE